MWGAGVGAQRRKPPNPAWEEAAGGKGLQMRQGLIWEWGVRDVACRADGGGHARIVHERPGGDRLQGIGEKPRQCGAGSEEGQAGTQEWN